MAHKWHPIKDLPELPELAHGELRYLAEIWHEQKDDLDQEQLRIFNEKLNREWAIETGLIERIYELDRGTTETLINRGISERWIPRQSGGGDPAKIAAILHDHENTIKGMFDFVEGTRNISVSYIKELHAALVRNQESATGVDKFGKKTEVPLLRGAFKKLPNNPKTPQGETHEYCPPEQTDSEMDNLISMHEEHIRRGISPLAEATWLHHRFVQIHPFQDGNGRVARCLATLVFIKAGWFPLVVHNEKREEYLDALEAADGGDLSPLINLFAEIQKRDFVNASGIVRKIQHDAQMESVIKSAAEKLQQQQNVNKEYENAQIVADNLAIYARGQLENACERINNECGDDEFCEVSSAKNNDSSEATIWNSVAENNGRQFGYYPNINVYAAWVCLSIQTRNHTFMIIHFHGVNREYRGIIACAFNFLTSPFDLSVKRLSEFPADKVFLINYKEPEHEIKKRFEEWLEKSLITGLRFWRDGL